MLKINKFLAHQECPGINGIYFPDGSVQILHVEHQWQADTGDIYSLNIGELTSIDDLEAAGSLDIWNDCAILFNKTFYDSKVRIVSGESDYGGDGFLGAFDYPSDKLLWLAFFDCSNPFHEATIVKNKIIAKSTNGSIWKVPITTPSLVEVK